MLKTVEAQHSSCLHLTEILSSILVGVATTCKGITYTHHGTIGTEGMSMLKLTMHGELQTTIPQII